MPATEQTWRSPKVMHAIFGGTALLMLVATVWMFAADHTREWKPIQETQRRIDQFYLAGRISEQRTTEYLAALTLAEDELAEARTEPLEEQLIEQFKAAADGASFAQFDEYTEQYATAAKAARAAMAEAKQAREAAERLRQKAVESEAGDDARLAADDRAAAREAMADAQQAQAQRLDALQVAIELREKMLAELTAIIAAARFDEDNLSRDKKFAAADLTAILSQHGIAIGAGEEELAAQLQTEADAIKVRLNELTAQLDLASAKRQHLERLYKGEKGLIARELLAQKKLDQAKADLDRLHAAAEGLWEETGRTLLGLPILDAFDNSDQRIDQIWLPKLTINNNFIDVARFDRCVTCHRAIDKTQPGTATEPAYPVQNDEPLTLVLDTPETAPAPQLNEQGELAPPSTRDLYGIELSQQGLLDPNDVVIQAVLPESPGAMAGLQLGDVIEAINGNRLVDREQATGYLLGGTEWGEPLTLTVRRGLPHPFASHPRLDLFVGSLSPHKKEEMGCTICHDGQGSATSFKWASHTPNDPNEADDWYYEHGWFDNHHWIFPMQPERFVESGCLKCHHDVTELEPSERFPQPPAPKLMTGYHLIREFGCFGCHEINGFNGPDQRIGPDMRAEPNYYAVAQQLLYLEDDFSAEERAWAERIIDAPEDDTARRLLYNALVEDKKLASDDEPQGEPRFAPAVHTLADQLKDVEAPGTLRKVGPSLRHVASKMDFDFLYSWIRNPQQFRPSTRMPRFFGLTSHLLDSEHGLAESAKYEPIEIRAISEYLLKASQPFEYLPVAEGVEPPSAERGKQLFQTRGCLACHSHADFPRVTADQGPDLSGMGVKLDTPDGASWLYSWLREPDRYHVRTKMPNVFLSPIDQPDGTRTDPAADIAAYLLKSKAAELGPVPPREMSTDEQQALADLALQHLAKQYPRRLATEYLETGIPAARAAEIKGDEIALVGMTPENRVAKQLEYVGRRAISKYGCSGCHDIPGYEAAKPIGTGLADWGRKDSAKLAFEQIFQFLALGGHGHGHTEAEEVVQRTGLTEKERRDPDVAFYLSAIEHHGRQGFIWQKLRQPRSYDYEKTENKDYNDRLRMPRFPLDAEQREAVITFVLGLVAEPPASQYVYQPDPRQQALVEGRKVLEKYNCGGCHVLDMERWEFDYHEDEFFDVSPAVDYPFLKNHFSAAEIADSLEQDQRGMRHADLYGRPNVNEETGEPQLVDIDGVPVEDISELEGDPAYYSFELWKPALINGQEWRVGMQDPLVRVEGVTRYPRWGGDLAYYLYPIVIEEERQRNPAAKASDAWGWLPPPLVGQGRKTQTDWLHDFLLDPYPIRPAVVLRMPRFNLSSDEATKVANYFAAVDNATYPYEYDPRMGTPYLQSLAEQRPASMDDALRVITNNNYCVKCHLVGDFTPSGSPKALAPNLDQVHRRLRPEYVREWIANPPRILPYTGMPVNIPYSADSPHLGGISQELYPGTSIEQLDGVVDFLMNYDRYARKQISIQALLQPAQPQAPPAEGQPQQPPAEAAAAREPNRNAPSTN